MVSVIFMNPKNRAKSGFWRKIKHIKQKIRFLGVFLYEMCFYCSFSEKKGTCKIVFIKTLLFPLFLEI